VLDLWFERVVKPRLRGEALHGAVYRRLRVVFPISCGCSSCSGSAAKRLRRIQSDSGTEAKTKLVEFGRYAHRHASKRGRKRPETIYFLGFTLYCTRNQKGNFRIGMRTEKSRLRRAFMRLQDQMRRMRHLPIGEQGTSQSNASRSLCVLRHCRESSGTATGPSGRGTLLAQNAEQSELARAVWWTQFQRIKSQFPLLATKAVSLLLPGAAGYRQTVNQLPTSPVREIRTLGSVGAGGG
jgi:RNA-directed DNA polymerase